MSITIQKHIFPQEIKTCLVINVLRLQLNYLIQTSLTFISLKYAILTTIPQKAGKLGKNLSVF